MFTHLDPSYFDWLSWRATSFQEIFGFRCRYSDLTSLVGKRRIREAAVGWCHSGYCLCRPKLGQFALMCFKDGEHFWFHLRKSEFEKIFWS